MEKQRKREEDRVETGTRRKASNINLERRKRRYKSSGGDKE
jgi:hypothetical protein